MPNWCANELHIVGDEKVVKKFLKAVKDKKEDLLISFEKLCPISDPENWYNERIAKWGTKWEPCGFTVYQDDPDHYVIGMSTAWDSPAGVLPVWAKKFPQLEFLMMSFEGGCGFWKTQYCKGEDCRLIAGDINYEEIKDDPDYCYKITNNDEIKKESVSIVPEHLREEVLPFWYFYCDEKI